MRYELVIFDLDGTLLNTLDDLADACNAALREAGFPTRTPDEVRRFVGNGVSRLIRRAVPEGTEEAVARHVLDRFKSLYMENVNVKTVPYDGILPMLSALRAGGIRTAVNSNKVDAATRRLCDCHFSGMIDLALGERDGIPKKPAPDGALRIMAQLGAAPGRTLYVGDGEADIRTALNAGTDMAWVSWGFRRRDELEGLHIPRAFDSARALEHYILGV